MSGSKIFLKPREEIRGYKSKVDKMVPAPTRFHESFTEDQRKVYKKLACFVENSRPVEDYKDAISRNFYDDLSNEILGFLHPSHFPVQDRVMLLHGLAGAGKTYVASVLIGSLLRNLQENERICVIAPTHKAKKIISSQVFSITKRMLRNHTYQPGSIWFATISRFLEQKPVYDKEGNSSFRTHVNLDNLRNLRYLFIDEASMISVEDWEDLKEYVINRLPNLSVVVMGDDHQLPPVGEKTSKVIRDIRNRVDLSQIIRAKSACMIKMYKTFRDFVDKRKVYIPDKLERQGCFKRTHRLHSYIRKHFDPRKDKILSYSNSSVDAYNKLARELMFGKDAPRFSDGDILIFRGIYKHAPRSEVYFYTNDEVEVISSVESKVSINETLDRYSLKEKRKLKEFFPGIVFKTHKIEAVYNGTAYTFNVIHEDDEARFKDYMRRARARVKSNMRFDTGFSQSDIWSLYWDVRKYVNCPLKYSYALTIYKSQGSTYRYAFIDARNVANCIKSKSISQYTRTLYTAATRASDRVYYADLLPVDEKVDTEQVIQQDKDLWPYLKKYKLTQPQELKEKQVVRVTSPAHNVKKRKIQILQILEVKSKSLMVTDNVRKFKLSLNDKVQIYV